MKTRSGIAPRRVFPIQYPHELIAGSAGAFYTAPVRPISELP